MSQAQNPDEWRLYTVVMGLYMKEIQWGIQTAHATSTMTDTVSEGLFAALSNPTNASQQREAEKLAAMTLYMKVHQWAQHPTTIVCDGLNYKGVKEAAEIAAFYAHGLELPYACFHEDEDSLGGLLTCVGILVPRNFFMATPIRNPEGDVVMYILEDGTEVTPSGSGRIGWTFTLVNYIKNLRLVR